MLLNATAVILEAGACHVAVTCVNRRAIVTMVGRLVRCDRSPHADWSVVTRAACGCDVTVDLRQVSQIDAEGLGRLAGLCRDARMRGATVCLEGANARVARLLTLCGLCGGGRDACASVATPIRRPHAIAGPQ